MSAVANTVTKEEVFESERGRCWPLSSEKWLLWCGEITEWQDHDGDEGGRAHGKNDVCLGQPLPALFLGLFGGMMLTVTHPLL